MEAVGRVHPRYRISEAIPDHPFTDYWDVFVLKHQNPFNIAAHMLGVVIFYGIVVWAIFSRNPWLLPLTLLSQGTGLLGHRLFERTSIDPQDAVFSVRASRCLNRYSMGSYCWP